jgi:hypothetical protein
LFRLRTILSQVLIASFLAVILVPYAAAAQKGVLLQSHFADLKDKWTVWDDPTAKNGPSKWRIGLAELSEIARRDGKMATALLAGGKDWTDYAVETSLFMANASGNLAGIVFGYQGPEQYCIAGYNFETHQYEIEARTPAGFELLQSVKKRFPSKEEVGLRVEFTGSHIRLAAGGEDVLAVDEARFKNGQFGLGASDMRGGRVHFGKVKVTSLGGAGAAAGNILFEEDFSAPDLSKWQVWDDPAASPKKSQWRLVLSEFSGIRNELEETATAVVAGEAAWNGYAARTNLFAVQANGDLSGIVFGYQDQTNFYIAGYNFSRNRFELAERTARGFSILAFAEMDYPRREWHPIQVDFRGGRLVFKFDDRTLFDVDESHFRQGRVGLGTSRLANGDILFDTIEVSSLGTAGAPKRELQDLLAGRRGAAVIYRPSAPLSDPFMDMLDHPVEDEKSLANTYDLDLAKVKLPEEAVFCFPQGRFAEVRRIDFALARDNAPKEIRFWTSLQSPKAGFEPLATLQVEAKPGSVQQFEVPATKAKYLKIQIVSGHTAKRIQVPEMYVRGYFLERPPAPDGSDKLGPVDIREKEPNDTVGQAQAIPLAKFVGGTAAGGDADHFRIGLKDKPVGTLKLSLETKGIIRPRVTLTDESGRAVKPRADSSAGGVTVLVYDVDPGDHTLKVERPDSYLTLVYDDSSSMGKSVEIVKSVLKGYLDNLGQGLNLQLMKYANDPIFLSDFTNKPAELREAVDKKVGGGGGTETLKGLTAAVQSVAKQPGSRAVLAIFDDLQHSGSDRLEAYIRLWDAVLDQGVAFSTIGVQSGWDDKTPYFGNSQEQIFRELAYSSLGGFFLSPTAEKVKESAERIFKLLTSPMEYRFILEWAEAERRAPGSIEVKLDRAAEKEAGKSVEIIMDASNSMWGQIGGEAKITIARKVLAETIGGLPDTMNVGLRVYGHRYALNDPKACADTELLVPIGPVDKKGLVDTVNRIQLKGKTPLVMSVLEAVKDFEKVPNGSIVLVTDGIESCGGDIASIAPAIKKAGLELQVHIVGFDIKEKQARAELESIARSTGGRYIDARNADELMGALGQTLKLEYVVLDAGGGEAGRGVAGGGAVKLDPGSYTVRVLVAPEPLEIAVSVKSGGAVSLTLKKIQGQWIIE